MEPWANIPDHPMWSDLLDANGAQRATIFYKSTFWDRDAFMTASDIFSIDRNFDNKTSIKLRVVKTGSQVLFETTEEAVNGDAERIGCRIDGIWYPPKSELHQKQCETWLNEHYPRWQVKGAYWDETLEESAELDNLFVAQNK